MGERRPYDVGFSPSYGRNVCTAELRQTCWRCFARTLVNSMRVRWPVETAIRPRSSTLPCTTTEGETASKMQPRTGLELESHTARNLPAPTRGYLGVRDAAGERPRIASGSCDEAGEQGRHPPSVIRSPSTDRPSHRAAEPLKVESAGQRHERDERFGELLAMEGARQL